MKKFILTVVLGLISIFSYSQSYGDLFTTYKDASQVTYKQIGPIYSVPKTSTIDVDEYIRRITPQNVQVTTGIYLKGNSIQPVKIQVGTIRRKIVVTSYWDGSQWSKSRSYASDIPTSAPKELRQACMYKVYIPSLGYIYF